MAIEFRLIVYSHDDPSEKFIVIDNGRLIDPDKPLMTSHLREDLIMSFDEDGLIGFGLLNFNETRDPISVLRYRLDHTDHHYDLPEVRRIHKGISRL